MIGQDRIVAWPLAMAGVAGDRRRRPLARAAARSRADPRADRPRARRERDTLRPLMRDVVTSGTGTALRDVPGEVIGKSGTAEYGGGDPPPTHAWFIAARDDLAVAVLVEDGRSGGVGRRADRGALLRGGHGRGAAGGADRAAALGPAGCRAPLARPRARAECVPRPALASSRGVYCITEGEKGGGGPRRERLRTRPARSASADAPRPAATVDFVDLRLNNTTLATARRRRARLRARVRVDQGFSPKKSASSSCPSNGSTCATYWSGRTTTSSPARGRCRAGRRCRRPRVGVKTFS